MLVLSRTKGQSVLLGDVIEVTVVEIRGDKVRLGVVAPGDISVHRREVWDAIARQAPPTPQPSERLVGPGQSPCGPMLILSRKKNESILINGNITVLVVDIRGDKVRLGIESPRDVPPHRREVYDAIRRADAANKAGTDATRST